MWPMSSLTLTLGAKDREKKNNLRKRIENRKKIRKELSPLLTILTASKLYISDKRSGIDKQISTDMRKNYRTKISITYYLSTSNIFDSIMDNNYLSFVLPKISVEVNILLLVHILLLVWINLVPFHVRSLHYWLYGSLWSSWKTRLDFWGL